MPEALTGPARYVLPVPALGAADYARLQAVLLRVAAARPGWPRRLAGLAGAVLAGALIGYLAGTWEIEAELWVAARGDPEFLTLGGTGILLALLGVAGATMLALGLVLVSRQRAGMRALHAAGGDLFGAHELVLAEGGLLWRNASRTLFVPWSRLTGAERQGGMLFLVADRISAFWLPEALIAAHPDRAGLEELLRRHGALP